MVTSHIIISSHTLITNLIVVKHVDSFSQLGEFGLLAGLDDFVEGFLLSGCGTGRRRRRGFRRREALGGSQTGKTRLRAAQRTAARSARSIPRQTSSCVKGRERVSDRESDRERVSDTVSDRESDKESDRESDRKRDSKRVGDRESDTRKTSHEYRKTLQAAADIQKIPNPTNTSIEKPLAWLSYYTVC